MTQVNKNDVNQIFASNAPDQDKPPSFPNYTTGWGTSRSNNGKPTIKGFNFLQQRSDQNILWIHQNGGALPYDSSIDYVDGSIVLKDGRISKLVDGTWIDVLKSENPTALPPYYDSSVTYQVGSRIMLDDNSGFVVSTIANNSNNPNSNMEGWVSSLAKYSYVVDSLSDLSKLKAWDGRTAYLKGFGELVYKNGEWSKDVIVSNMLNLLDFIPSNMHQYISDYTNARNNFDAYPYLKACEAVALQLNKPIYVPSGYYPLSQTYVQPNFINITGDLGRTWFIPTKEFPEKTWLWEFGLTGMTATSLNDVCFQGNDKNSDSAYYGGLLLSKRAWFCNIKNIRFMNLSYGGLLIAPRYNPSESGVPDLVNLNIDNLFFLDCGSSQYYPTFDINLTADSATSLSGNWTDGSVKNIDIACADGDQQNTRGGIGFRLRTKDVTLFNVVFDRFFIGTRLQSHTYIDAPLMNGNTFSNFSGETHNTIYNGQGIPTDYTYQHNWENLGQWNTLQNINSNMSLGDLGSMQKGLYLNNSYSNTISNMPLNASYANNQLELLNITSNANLTTFDNCNVRLLENKDWNIAWGIINNLFTNTIIDKGINTKFNGQQVNSNAIKERQLSYYSNLNSEGTAPINAQTGSGYDGLSFSQDSNSKSLSVTLASSTSTRKRNIYYVNKRSGKKVYYVVLRVKQTSGSLSNNYIEVGMFDQSYKRSFSALNSTQEFYFVFNTGGGVDGLVIALGNSSSTTESATFVLEEIYVSSNILPYKPNCTVVAEG